MQTTKILLVEDEVIIRLSMETSLKAIGYEVSTAGSGKGAVEKALNSHPDLILMDIRLGNDINGLEAAEKIRENMKVPIIFLTGYSDSETIEKIELMEQKNHVSKPFKMQNMEALIQNMLKNSGA